MARPQKRGLDYFPVDVDFFDDPRTIAIAQKFGSEGISMLMCLMCNIYKNGYYVEWNDFFRLKMVRDLGNVPEERINQILVQLIEWGIFDKAVFEEHQVLTSEEIQLRYKELRQRAKRVVTLDRFVLVQQESDESGVVDESPKGKKVSKKGRKLHKIIVQPVLVPQTDDEESASGGTAATAGGTGEGDKGFKPPTGEALTEVMKLPMFKAFNPTKKDVDDFLNYYTARDWILGTTGQKAADIKALFYTWLSRKDRSDGGAGKSHELPPGGGDEMARKQLDTHWNAFLEVIKTKVTKEQYETWFMNIRPVSFDMGVLDLYVDSPAVVDVIETKFAPVVKAALDKTFGAKTRLYYNNPLLRETS